MELKNKHTFQLVHNMESMYIVPRRLKFEVFRFFGCSGAPHITDKRPSNRCLAEKTTTEVGCDDQLSIHPCSHPSVPLPIWDRENQEDALSPGLEEEEKNADADEDED